LGKKAFVTIALGLFFTPCRVMSSWVETYPMQQASWNQILLFLEKSLNPGIFRVWIKPLEAECGENTLKLFAPNEFVAARVRDRLLEDVSQAATKVMGVRPEIKIKVKPRAAQKSGSARTPKTRELGLPGLAASRAFGRVWQFCFEDFVVGPSNELAFAAAKGLCGDRLGSDQLFMSSSPGLGKTHLLHAIGKSLGHGNGNKKFIRVAYLTAEEFASGLVMAIKAREVEEFKAKYREKLDVLLLEDIHFLQGKVKIQDELLSTLKALQARGCKVVFSSSFLPRELKDVDDQLASRFCSGFLAVIDKPDFETRKRILHTKAGLFQVALPESVSELMADRLRTDVRQLESCLQSLVLKARLLNAHIDVGLAGEVLKNYSQPADLAIGLEKIVDFICLNFEISPQQIKSKSRGRGIVLARNTAFFLARKHTDLSLKQIGSHFNRRHSTVLKAITNVEREIRLKTPVGRRISRTMERMALP